MIYLFEFVFENLYYQTALILYIIFIQSYLKYIYSSFT